MALLSSPLLQRFLGPFHDSRHVKQHTTPPPPPAAAIVIIRCGGLQLTDRVRYLSWLKHVKKWQGVVVRKYSEINSDRDTAACRVVSS
jgi:hypothetical protein